MFSFWQRCGCYFASCLALAAITDWVQGYGLDFFSLKFWLRALVVTYAIDAWGEHFSRMRGK